MYQTHFDALDFEYICHIKRMYQFVTARIRRMREGNVFSLFTSGGGGVPVSHNALQHFPECHGAAGGGTLPGPAGGGYPGRGVPWQGKGGTLAGRGYPGWGGTQLGQHREYLLHSGRYASCVHAGGLSCFKYYQSFFLQSL